MSGLARVRRGVGLVLRGGAWAGVVVLGVLVATPGLARGHYLLDNLSNFQIQYAVGAVVLGVCCLVLRVWRAAGVAGVLLLVCGLRLWPVALAPMPEGVGSAPLRVVSANLLYTNPRTEAFLAFVAEKDPDFVAIQEFGERVFGEIDAALRPRYTFASTSPMDEPQGVGFYARVPCEAYPFSKEELRALVHVGGSKRMFTRYKVSAEAGMFVLYNVHPFPPAGAQLQRERNEQLRLLGEFIAGETLPVLMVGDLNVSTWSPYFRDFFEATALHSARGGRAPMPTWPAGGLRPVAMFTPAVLRPLIQIPIDHVLGTRGIGFEALEIGPATGSDHLPMYAAFRVGTAGR